jgi:hypothetical protein
MSRTIGSRDNASSQCLESLPDSTLTFTWEPNHLKYHRLPDRYIELARPRIPFPDPGPLHIEDLTQKQTRR